MKNKGAIIFVNSITMVRLLGTLLMPFISMILSPENLIIYIICLLLTDSFDGMFARRLKACTIFGTLLDALADKMLGIASLAILAQYYPVMLIPILAETFIVLINVKAAVNGSPVESSKLGKIKTWVLGIIIIFGFFTIYANDIIVLFNYNNFGIVFINFFKYLITHAIVIINSLACLAIGADLMVSADYIVQNHQYIKKLKNKEAKKHTELKTGKELIHALFDNEYYKQTKHLPILKRLGKEISYEKTSGK